MILEYAQLLSTAHHVIDGTPKREVYRPTHINHPSAVWTRQSFNNYNWLWALLRETCKEYTHRYGKVHKVESSCLLKRLWFQPETPIMTSAPLSAPPQCMPEEYKKDNTVEAYREYYIKGKTNLLKWTKRETPYWITQHETKC